MLRVKLEADDWMAILALASQIAMSIEQFLLAHNINRIPHDGPPSMNVINSLSQLEIASQLTYNLLITTVRLSILLLYRRIFTLAAKKEFRIAWYFCTALTLAYCVAILADFLTECHELSHGQIKCRKTGSGFRLEPVITAFLNVGIDLSIWMLPLHTVWTLHLSVRKKLEVCAVFALGLIGVAVSTARATILLDMTDTTGDTTGSNGVSYACWGTAEPAVGLLCANLPLLRPLFTSAYHKLSTVRSNDAASVSNGVAITRAEPTSSKGKDMVSVSTVQVPQSPIWGLETAREQVEPNSMI